MSKYIKITSKHLYSGVYYIINKSQINYFDLVGKITTKFPTKISQRGVQDGRKSDI